MTASDDWLVLRRVHRNEPLGEGRLRDGEVAAGDAERLLVLGELLLDELELGVASW